MAIPGDTPTIAADHDTARLHAGVPTQPRISHSDLHTLRPYWHECPNRARSARHCSSATRQNVVSRWLCASCFWRSELPVAGRGVLDSPRASRLRPVHSIGAPSGCPRWARSGPWKAESTAARRQMAFLFVYSIPNPARASYQHNGSTPRGRSGPRALTLTRSTCSQNPDSISICRADGESTKVHRQRPRHFTCKRHCLSHPITTPSPPQQAA